MRHIELWDSCINHYVEFDTDDIEIDCKTLSEHDKEIYNKAIDSLVEEISNRPLVNYFQMLEIIQIAEQLKSKTE